MTQVEKLKIKFRKLRADEIECRIGQIGKNGNGLSLLLYKTARCDMDLLDEVVGPENWQREHYECKGNLFCRVGINTNYNVPESVNWVYKSDCGSESNTEKEKGEASDSFKRACVNWGIGRELYTAPFIWVTDCKIENSKCYDKFVVSNISYKDSKITELTIKNEKTGNVVFEMNKISNNKKKEAVNDIVCTKCGKPIMMLTGKDNKLYSAEEVAKLCKGMCKECYEVTKNERKNTVPKYIP